MATVDIKGLGTGSRSNILVKFKHFRRLRCGHRSHWDVLQLPTYGI